MRNINDNNKRFFFFFVLIYVIYTCGILFSSFVLLYLSFLFFFSQSLFVRRFGFAIFTFGSTFIGKGIVCTPRAICCCYGIAIFPYFTLHTFFCSNMAGICASNTRLACIGLGFGVVPGFTVQTRFRPKFGIFPSRTILASNRQYLTGF